MGICFWAEGRTSHRPPAAAPAKAATRGDLGLDAMPASNCFCLLPLLDGVPEGGEGSDGPRRPSHDFVNLRGLSITQA